MSTRPSSIPDAWLNLPAQLRRAAEGELRPGESMLAWFEPDLNAELRFAQGLVVLTEQRVLSVDFDAGGAVQWRQWPLEPGTRLRTKEEGAAGALELLNERGRLTHWRFTPGRASAAHRLAARFHALREGGPADEEEEGEAGEWLCQGCGLPILPETSLCSACTAAAATRPAQSLLRLAPLARPRVGMIALGVGLSMAATAASLIPTYLQAPIIDRVLVPYEKTGENNFRLMPWYLLGMAAASLATFLLAWGRNYVLAWVSERIAPTCATPHTRTCSGCRWSSSAPVAPAT